MAVEPHGIGCVLSAALAAYLAQDCTLSQAVRRSEEFISRILSFCQAIGEGRKVADPLLNLYNASEELTVIESIQASLKIIREHESAFLPYIAEVGTQIAMALPYPTTLGDVAAVEGRLRREAHAIRTTGHVKFGASSHMARVILSCIRHNPMIRAAMNLHYGDDLLRGFERVGFTVSTFDRRLEPAEVKQIEGATLSWGVEQAIRAAGQVTDVIYDLGDIEREPMIRILGSDAEEVVMKALKGISRSSV
jgi:hydroxymethylpyrimidine/phosphomethylpyrimidine kinase